MNYKYIPTLGLVWLLLTCVAHVAKYQRELVVINTPVMREATMIDTNSVVYHHKGNVTIEPRGLFRDKETGLTFYDPINDSLYRQFEKGDNKPIGVKWKYTDAKRGGPDKERKETVTYKLLGSVVLTIILTVLVVSTIISVRSEEKSEEYP